MSKPENQSFQEEKVLFTTKKTESRVPSLLKMQRNKEKKNEWQKIQIFSFSSWNEIFEEKGQEPSRVENPSARPMAQASSARTHHYYIPN